MSRIAIKVENVSKQYRIGEVSSGNLSHDLNRWWHTIRGKEDPYLKIGEENDRSKKGLIDYVWAVKDISFELRQGEILGIIGRNGAGKSTLLKILSRTTAPTEGRIKARGRLASLLEVGTGFHPELSGRENIFLNGAILGMQKHEIRKKFDEIVDFSGVERYIDTPVKRYSSGMYVRLAFAVAAHLESEILIVDEVLAVGDAEFQKKCLGKMGSIRSEEGRTVLFVSHNMAAVKELCTHAIMLKNGVVAQAGGVNELVRSYLSTQVTLASDKDLNGDLKSRRGNGQIRFSEVQINNNQPFLDPLEEIHVRVKAIVHQSVPSVYFSMIVRGPENFEPITSTGFYCIADKEIGQGATISFEVKIPAHTFRTGLFPVYFWLGRKAELAEDNYPYDIIDSIHYLNISSDKSRNELGYSSAEPEGYFNFHSSIVNLQII